MARFTLRLPADVCAEQAWARVWDLDAHSALIPLTRLRGDGTGGRPLHPGARFVARTGLGPLGVDDIMVAEVFTPPTDTTPARAVVTKRGSLIGGRIEATATPADESADDRGSTVHWRQEITVRGVPAVADPLVGLVAKTAYRHVLRRLLARART